MSSSPTPEQFRDASWADILPYYEELASAPLDSGNAAEWMERWSLLDRAVVEATLSARGEVTCTCRGVFVAVREGHPAYHRW